MCFFANLRSGDNIDLLTLWIGPRWSTFIVENIIEAIFLTWGQNIIVVFYSVRLPFHIEIISEIWRFVYRGFYWSNFGLIFLPDLFCSTGKSLSEALIFASTNPQFDDWLFIELQVQYMKIPSSNLGRTCCVQKLFLTFRTIFVHNLLSQCSAKRRASDKDLPVLQKNFTEPWLYDGIKN